MMAPTTAHKLLSNHPLFGVLPETVLKDFYKKLSPLKLVKNQYLFIQDDEAENAFIVKTGQILLESISLDGGRISFDKLGPGAFFGEFALLDNGTRSTSAVAISPVKLIRIPKGAFLSLITDHPPIALELIQHLVQLMRRADAQIESMQFKNLLQKVAHFLVIEHLRPQSHNNIIYITQVEIARRLSASREKVNRALKTLKSRGLISTARGAIVINDVNRLRRIYSDL